MNPAEIVALISAHKWVPLAALVVGLCVRLLKSDTRIPIDIPPRWRIWLAFALGGASGVLQAITTGTSWSDALIGGIVSTVMAILGQNVVVDSLRGGKEIPIPGLIKPGVSPGPGKPPSLKPPGYIPPLPTLFMCLLIGSVTLSGCALFTKQNVKTVLDVVQVACAIENATLGDAQIAQVCGIADALIPDIRTILASHRAAMARARAATACGGDAGK